MKIACLQFSPVLGDVDNNLTRADAVLAKANVQDLDLLVLPELAFSGYNFKSLQHISPYLEPTTSGISSLWARTTALKYECVVIVGYPEKVDISPKWPASPEYYNSAITVNKDGETISNYRKSFLYHTDSKWALEGPDGFFDGEIDGLGNVAIGICKWPTKSFERMDLNPYKFEAPWSAWEFAYHIIHKQANLVVLSMAWRTREDVRSYSRQPKEPDMDTLAYWLARLEPVIRAEQKGEIIVVFANRTGVEDDAVYTGTSAVLGICGGEVKVYGLLGRGEKELLVVDTSIRPKAKLVADPKPSSSEKADSETSKSSRTVSPSSATPPNTKVKSKKSESKSPPRLDPKIRDKRDNSTNSSIDEILNTVTPISPVEPMSPHAYFSSLGKKKDKSSETPPTIKPPAKLDTSVSGSTFDRTPTPFPDPKTAPKDSIKSPAPIPTPVIPSKPSATSSGRPLTPPTSPSVPTPSKTSFRPVSPKSRNASRTRPIQEDPIILTSQEVAQDPNIMASIIGIIEEKKLKPSVVVDQSKVPHTLSPTPNRRSLSPRPSSTVW